MRFASGRRRFTLSAASLAICLTTGIIPIGASAESYPSHPIRLVVAYAPGGSTDTVGRLYAQELTQELGQSVVVENRAGAGTLIGTDLVKRATPDGYTLLYGTNAFVIASMLHKSANYDPLKDFQPVSLTAVQSLGILVSPKLNIHTVQELIEYARAHPNKLNFASSGNGSAQHLAGVAFAKAAGIKMLHIPYKGAGPALTDLLAGRVHLMFTSLVGTLDYAKEGKLNLIATTGAKRSPATPNIPTVQESGVQDFVVESWQAMLAPAGTPKTVIERLNAAVVQASHNPKITEKLAAQGMEVRSSTPEELHNFLSKEKATYETLLAQTDIKIQ